MKYEENQRVSFAFQPKKEEVKLSSYKQWEKAWL